MKRTVMDLSGIAVVCMLLPCTALAFDSGSTGADGDFNPQVSVEVPLPPNGILNYRSVNIPIGVTVTFKRNVANTPVVMLVQGDVVIAGSIDISGKNSAMMGPDGDGNLFDDGVPGIGGPGGYDGGYGGVPDADVGGSGLGPGAGGGGIPYIGQGGSASFGTLGTSNGASVSPVYGSPQLIPLVGGSGGGGGTCLGVGGGVCFRGFGGGGGGGAIVIAGSGSVTVSGKILANGGTSATASAGNRQGAVGGQGSGGAIKIVASRLAVTGPAVSSVIEAVGGDLGGLYGGVGRIRLEADTFGAVRSTSPAFSSGTPNPLFLPGLPALRFATVGGIPVPASPTGSKDVTVPTTTPNPVSITLATSGVPVGSTIKVSLTPQLGPSISVDSSPTVGAIDNATTSVSVDIPTGHSVLSAQTSFIVLAALGDALSRFAQGERVEKVTLTSTLGQRDKATLHTVAGRQFEVEPALLKLAALSQ